MPTVIVVDDDEPMCRALAHSLSGDGYRVRTYTSATSYLLERDSIDPDCVVADINMPGLDGLGYEVPTVYVFARVDVPAAMRAMKEGALDLLEKPADEVMLVATVRHAIARSKVLRAARLELAGAWHALNHLTPREAEVCALVASGRLNKQIAALIGTTVKTVKVHRARVMQKLGVQSVAELVRLVDRVLADQSVVLPFNADQRGINRPRALGLMASALATVAMVRAEHDASALAPPRYARHDAAAVEQLQLM